MPTHIVVILWGLGALCIGAPLVVIVAMSVWTLWRGVGLRRLARRWGLTFSRSPEAARVARLPKAVGFAEESHRPAAFRYEVLLEGDVRAGSSSVRVSTGDRSFAFRLWRRQGAPRGASNPRHRESFLCAHLPFDSGSTVVLVPGGAALERRGTPRALLDVRSNNRAVAGALASRAIGEAFHRAGARQVQIGAGVLHVHGPGGRWSVRRVDAMLTLVREIAAAWPSDG